MPRMALRAAQHRRRRAGSGSYATAVRRHISVVIMCVCLVEAAVWASAAPLGGLGIPDRATAKIFAEKYSRFQTTFNSTDCPAGGPPDFTNHPHHLSSTRQAELPADVIFEPPPLQLLPDKSSCRGAQISAKTGHGAGDRRRGVRVSRLGQSKKKSRKGDDLPWLAVAAAATAAAVANEQVQVSPAPRSPHRRQTVSGWLLLPVALLALGSVGAAEAAAAAAAEQPSVASAADRSAGTIFEGLETNLPWDVATWDWWFFLVWELTNVAALELVALAAQNLVGPLLLPDPSPPLPKRGVMHEFGWKDYRCIIFNKLFLPIFVYHTFRWVWLSPKIKWQLSMAELSLLNTVGALVFFVVGYDFMYSLFHRLLHQRTIYRWIHKHHHQQHACVNGLDDAINDHPVEYITGEYMHLLVMALVPFDAHIVAILAFAGVAATLPALNHTRLDVRLPFGIYAVTNHDQHHVYPNCNYGNCESPSLHTSTCT
jgi:sterol desaturase/sphingolipid hydroxylase (fatty acid hydroxylase superfamily)